MHLIPSRVRARFCLPAAILLGAAASALAQAPTISGFSPSTIGIGMPVVITGTNFSGPGITGLTVKFNGVAAAGTVVNSSTQITATVPSPLNPGNITVQTSLGIATSATTYAVNGAPIITGFTPATGPEKRVVAITGYNFNGVVNGTTITRTVTINGLSVGSFSVSNTTFTCAVPVGAITAPFIMQGNLGTAVSNTFIVAAGAPPANDNFANATPISGSSGSITGTNTNATSEPGEPVHPGNAGGASVWFKWTAPTTGNFLFNPFDSSSSQFGIVEAIYTGNAVNSLTLVANGLASTSVFTRYASAAALSAVAGTTYYIVLDGFNGLMADYKLQWSPLGAPTISNFTPTTGAAGQTLSISVSGSGFVPGATVTLGGAVVSPSRLTFNSSSSITISQIPANAVTGPITVTTIAGTATSAASFVIPSISISSFTPTSGVAGTSVVINGTNFTGATQVNFNGTSAVFTVTAPTQITATVPGGATTGPISIAAPAGSATSSTSFVVLQPPTIASFSPASGPAGTSVVITGTNLTSTSDVQFNGVSAAFTVNSATQITATVPVGPIAAAPITVVTPAGSAVSSGSFSTTPPPPAITGFSPASFTPTMGVLISGTDFTGATLVSVGGVPTAQFTVNSATLITVRVPFNVPSSGVITVTTPYGTGASATQYTLLPPAVPSITSFSPAAIGPTAVVTINGSGFSDVTSVLFNGVTSTFTVLSPTQIVANAPTNLTAGAITVNTSIGSATSATDYTISLAPVITNITPNVGPVNRIITVQGFNFSGTGITNQVLLVNGTPIGSFSRGSTTYTFAIPAGATTGPITLQTSQGFAVSPLNLNVVNLPPPANDDFANATVISGTTGTFNGNTANATKEPGEPNHANNPGGASVWFSWTAPGSGLYLFNPANPSSSQFGIIQSIYTGNAVNSLTLVASGQTPTSVFARFGSAAVLNAVAGTTYRIALDGYNGVMADYRLTWAPLGAPTISGFSPSGGSAGQSTITININGSQFTPGAAVLIGGASVNPARINYQNANLITVTEVPLTATTGPISVTTPAGTATSATAFQVTPPGPTISSFSPTNGAVGATVTITGMNLATTSSVMFNGVAATLIAVSNDTTITAAVPSGASTGNITVTTLGGSATTTTPFVVIVPPAITAEPQTQTVTVGDTATFTVGATSNAAIDYQWLKNGAPIIGNISATTSTLKLVGVTMADVDLYSCQVSNVAGSAVSDSARLWVNPALVTVTLSGLAAIYDGSPKAATATTSQPVAAIDILYNGLPTPPTNAGSYSVIAIINDPNYFGFAHDTLTIAPANVTVALVGLNQTYNGSPRVVTASTTPATMPVAITYDGSPTAPTNAGTYAVVATVSDPNYAGTTNGSLTVAKASATITLAGLLQDYDGTPKSVTATTDPADLHVVITYDGNAAAPTLPGTHTISATIDEANYSGSATATLEIGTTALVSTAPNIQGGLDGSIQVLSLENIGLNGNAWVSGDLLVSGAPAVQLNGHPTYGGTIDASSNPASTSQTITLGGSATLRHVVRGVDARPMPTVDAPPAPAGTRNVTIRTASDRAGDFATLRDLTVTGSAGDVAIPAGTYGNLTVSGSGGITLGALDATTPSVYNLQRLTLTGNSRLNIIGPVLLTVAGDVTLNGQVASSAASHLLTLQIAAGDLTLGGGAHLTARVIAPNGSVTVNSATLAGEIISEALTISGSGLLENAP